MDTMKLSNTSFGCKIQDLKLSNTSFGCKIQDCILVWKCIIYQNCL